ncbi:MAG: hypothetical protein ACJA2C_000608 [Marinoscillum sp.]
MIGWTGVPGYESPKFGWVITSYETICSCSQVITYSGCYSCDTGEYQPGGGTGRDEPSDNIEEGPELIEMSDYLTPTNPADNVNNPTDGMTATDKDGIVYTYDAEIGSWLMPEAVIVANNPNYILNVPKNMGSAFVITFAPAALLEPTFVGEVIVAGTYTVLTLVYIYRMHKYIELASVDEKDWDVCLRIYQLCNNGHCDDCLGICRANAGEWPFWKCQI